MSAAAKHGRPTAGTSGRGRARRHVMGKSSHQHLHAATIRMLVVGSTALGQSETAAAGPFGASYPIVATGQGTSYDTSAQIDCPTG